MLLLFLLITNYSYNSIAEVKLNYLDKRYEFSVSLHQLGVLLLFNIATVYTFKDIRDHIGLSEQELKRVMKV